MAVVAKQLEFEVVSIKPEPPTRPEDIGPGGGGIDCLATDGRFGSPQSQGAALGRCFGRHVSLMWLIDAAYDLGAQAPGRIVQTGYSKPNPGPGMQFEPWISDLWDHGYEIEAKAENPATTTREQLRQMLRAMLADRFKLRVTQEKREVEALALSVESGGPKLREVATESGIRLQRQIVGGVRQIRVSGSGRMSAFITGHQPFFITDNTGLTGIYAFDLSYEVPVPPPQEGGARGGGGGAGPSPWLIALQNALREQLGLRLANEKVQANFVVIDHVEKPTEN
jgi:uncharacterized protein (TIGR03435 family)